MKEFNIKEMENYEIVEIKDDLVMLESLMNGSREGDTLAKAYHYINYLEERLAKIANNEERAKLLLQQKDYVVRKLTTRQLSDAEKCAECGFDGECTECSCSVCIIQ
ncbi:MAG: hypothetical protein ACRC7N_19795 [Clostridium sp.]